MRIFLRMENPLSASAFEQGIARRPKISLHKVPNPNYPLRILILLTFHQKGPGHGFSIVLVMLYASGSGKSFGESWKSMKPS